MIPGESRMSRATRKKKQEMNRIGFVGLGAMGMPMAKHLAASQFSVTAYDIRPAVVDAFAAEAGKGARSAAEALWRTLKCRPRHTSLTFA